MDTRATHGVVVVLLLSLLALTHEGGEATAAEETSLEGGIRGGVIVEGAPGEAQVELRRLFRAPSLPPVEYPVREVWPLSLSGPDAADSIAAPSLAPDGSFVVDGLAPGHYAVGATMKDGRRAWARVILPARTWRSCVLRIPATGHEVSGRLLYADGRVFDGLAILVRMEGTWMGPYMHESSPATVDFEGRFRFTGVGAGAYAVVALLPGRLRAPTAPFEVPLTKEPTRVVDEGVSMVNGICRDTSGGAVAKADVWVVGEGFLAHAATNEAGEYRVAATRGAGFHVVAEGFTPAVREGAGGNVVAGGDVVVAPSPVLTGRVTSSAGKPEAGTPVHVLLKGEAPSHDPLSAWTTRTDADGRYRFRGLPAGRYTVVAFGAGRASPGAWSSWGGKVVTIAAGGEDPVVDVEVSPSAAIAGVVRDENERPLQGVEVDAGLAAARYEWARRVLGGAVTDEAGRFRLDGLQPEATYEISISPPGLPSFRATVRTPAAGAQAEVPLRTPAARHLRVRVLDFESGDPVPGTTIRASQGGGSWYDLGSVGTDGEALLGPLHVGECFLRASAWGWTMAPRGRPGVPEGRVVLALEGEVQSAQLAMVRALGIRGRVLRSDGAPAVGAEVVAVDLFDGSYAVWPPVTTAEDGRFELVGLRAEGYRIEVRATPPPAGAFPWKPDVSVKVEAGQEEIRLRLPSR